MAKKNKKNKFKNPTKNTNKYHKQIKNVFVTEGMYSTYTFFTLGKKLFIYSSQNKEQVFEIVEQPLTYNYFGEPIAYSEDDRQWIDYHMSQGNFDAALNIHRAYVKE